MTDTNASLKACPVFGETEARKAWITAEQKLLEEYVDAYEMCCDEGYYDPTKHERDLIRDALQGFVVEHDELLAKHLAANTRTPPFVERLREALKYAPGALISVEAKGFPVNIRISDLHAILDATEQQAATSAELREALVGMLSFAEAHTDKDYAKVLFARTALAKVQS